jgi:parallel beta-helix repeat protein
VNNRGQGITFEISYKAVIRNNVVEGNDDWGIIVRDSPDVQIYGNTIGRNANGPVMLFHRGRTDHPSKYGPHATKNVSVYRNTMTVQAGSGVKVGGFDQAGGALFRNNNRYFDNVYHVESPTSKAFKWNGFGLTYLKWRTLGLDTKGTFLVAGKTAAR